MVSPTSCRRRIDRRTALCGLGVLALAGSAAVRAAPDTRPPPLYSTRLPSPFTWTYRLRRGLLGGTGELAWQPQAQAYRLSIEGRVALIGSVLQQTSVGVLSAHGLSPTRFTDRRRGRPEQAAEFRRDIGKITFSAAAAEYRLLPGAQDRVSWMVQLAAIAQADPRRVAAGRSVVLYVVGARGDADLWEFRSEGVQPLAVGERRLRAVKLVRRGSREHDTRAEVWLDPGRQHLPVSARLDDGRGDPLELLLQTEG
ncbi:DUF3108 domain-containing protein [Aquabacterium sp. A7-Y]|uniref:DUF3108 domain-containing protein n=1 Tax=Aquabacterium sp. A7-Y TaxID=1349605 RepID=UPI00223E4149|nr:DUF3108 domain-containing protein [Aquabacterium sp. A7-Y]MCW7539604.1 DUF3108 domain-containing protein [Aquabacterium sp. A7-Y]